MSNRVAIIGAGPLGLIAMKILKEDGFEVRGYEARSWVGGLWKYSNDAALSAAENTIFNTSKYRSGTSDFPFPDGANDFPTADQLHQYLESYCDHFDLRRWIKLNTRVLNVTRENEEWILEVENKDSGKRFDPFDRIVVAIGTFNKPKVPQVDGLESFGGKHLHAIDFHNPSQFKEQTVLIVGLQATASDIAMALSNHAKKVYVSHRNGVIMLPRYQPNGTTSDQAQTLRMIFILVGLFSWFPQLGSWLYDKIVHNLSKKAFPNMPRSWGFSSAPSLDVSSALIADDIYALFQSGFAEPVSGVRRISGSNAVELSNGRVLDGIDTIIFCTGYETVISFLPKGINPYQEPGGVADLYHGTFPVHSDAGIRNSIAYLGHGSVPYPGFTQYEIQSMAISQTWLGNSPLPPFPELKRWHTRHLQWRQRLMARHKVDTFYVFFMPMGSHFKWLHDTAGTGLFENFGWFSRRAWSFWWKDRELYSLCLNGVPSPAIFRLFDMGKRKTLPWEEARSIIMLDNENAQRDKIRRLEEKKNR